MGCHRQEAGGDRRKGKEGVATRPIIGSAEKGLASLQQATLKRSFLSCSGQGWSHKTSGRPPVDDKFGQDRARSVLQTDL